MNEQTQIKIGFAVAFLAVLFTISPVINELNYLSFTFWRFTITVKFAYYLICCTLATAVYLQGLLFVSSSLKWLFQLLSDYLYALSLFIPVIYLMLYVINKYATLLIKYEVFPNSNTKGEPFEFYLILSMVVLPIWFYMAFSVLKGFSRRIAIVKLKEFENGEYKVLENAKQLFDQSFFDLSIIECYKSVQIAYGRLLLKLKIATKDPFNQDLSNITDLKIAGFTEELINSLQVVKTFYGRASYLVRKPKKSDAYEVIRKTEEILSFISNANPSK
jgi:hypothetical protein